MSVKGKIEFARENNWKICIYGLGQIGSGFCNELIDIFKIDEMKGFKSFNELQEINSIFNSIFNLPKGAKYKSNVFEYKKDYEGLHPTQKPVALLEDLIYTYSNKNIGI